MLCRFCEWECATGKPYSSATPLVSREEADPLAATGCIPHVSDSIHLTGCHRRARRASSLEPSPADRRYSVSLDLCSGDESELQYHPASGLIPPRATSPTRHLPRSGDLVQ